MFTNRITLALIFAVMASQAYAADQPAATPPSDRCKAVLQAAKDAQQQRVDEIREQERAAAKRAQEASSCLARAGDSIVRAAIPPSLGSILGVLTDPGGYIQNATSNAACNAVTNESNKVARGAQDINGAIRRAGSDAQYGFTGEVDKAVGGKGQSYGQYSGQRTEPDQGFFQSLSCRIFGRC